MPNSMPVSLRANQLLNATVLILLARCQVSAFCWSAEAPKGPQNQPNSLFRESLVVSKLDRLGRDAQDVGTTIKFLAARKIKIIVLQLGQLDLTSTPGKLMLTMLAAVAEMEHDLLVERTHAGLLRAKAEAKTLDRPPKTTPKQRAAIIGEYKRW